MKIVFSFDDGRSDAYSAYKTLIKYELRGSFHITTGFVDGTYLSSEFGTLRKPLTVKQLVEMNENGMDISSHGDKHIMSDDDYICSIGKLKEWGLVKDKYGFSVPHSRFTNEELCNFITDNSDTLQYIRIGRSPKCYSFLSKISYVLYSLAHIQLFYNYFEKHNLIFNLDRYKIVSLVVKRKTKIKNILNFIEKHKKEKCILVIMFHSIVNHPNDDWEYDLSDFEKLCVYCSNNNDLECKTLGELL